MAIIIITIIAVADSVALAATPDASREIVVGLSPLQPAAERTNQQCLLQRFLLSQCPTTTRVVIWDAWQLQVVSDVQPFHLNYDSPAARAPRLAPALAALARWSAGTSAAQVPASLKDSAAIKVPEWLDALATAPAAGRRTVVIFASPFCLVPDEPTFSMVQTRYPSDAHLARTSAESIYGAADRLGHLANTTVLWAYGSESLWASQHHRERVTRWWYLFMAAQGPNAALAAFSSDAPQILREALLANHPSMAHYALDPADTLVAMHIATERQVPVESRKVPPPPTVATPPQKPPPPPRRKLVEAPSKPSLPQQAPEPRMEPKPEPKPVPKPAPISPPVQVVLDVGVTDSTSTPVSGLSKADFTVLEDGVQQCIASFSADRAPISLILLLDTSGSIASKLDRIRAAASTIIHQAGDQDEFALVEFKAKVAVVQSFTSDASSADHALAALKPGGQTALLDALKFALEHASRNGRHERKGLVLITDGGEADSHSTRADVLPLLQRANVQFYAVGFPGGLDRAQSPDSRGHGPVKPQPTEALARDLLDTLAKASSGGRVFYPPKAADLGRIAQSIVSDLRAPRYTVGYYPIRPQSEAGWRTVQVLVPGSSGHGQLTARTRAGYFAGQPAHAHPVADAPTP